MNKEYKIYELILDKDTDGVHAYSLVDRPAIQENWFAFSEDEKIEVTFSFDEEKRTLIGPALIPDKQIFRVINGNEFFVYLSKDTIKETSNKFLKDNNSNNTTLFHSGDVEDVYVMESWIIDDVKNDKSNAYGFSLPEGTWMLSVKVDNDAIWELVKQGEIKGFSIEGNYSMVQKEETIKQEFNEVDNETEVTPEMELLNKIKDILDSIDE